MAAMTLDPREPDMSRFIDSYKYERQRDESIKQLSGGVSLPLNSDGYEDRQRFLKEERHKEMVEHQEKDVGYKHSVNPYPHPKLTRGPQNRTNYEFEIQKMTDRYHNQYDDVLVKGDEQQRKVEQERIEQRRRNRQPPAAPQGHQIDYNENQELARAEERKAYQDHQGKYSVPTEGKLHAKAPINYEESRKDLAEERKHDYALFLEKKAKEDRYRAMRGRPVTPPGMGLNVGQYDRQVRETKAQKTKEYKDSLDQQQKEQMFLKAQRDTELSVLDRKNQTDSQYLASKPPAGPGYKPRDEPVHHNQGYWNEGHRAPSPRSVDSEAQRRQRDDGVPLVIKHLLSCGR